MTDVFIENKNGFFSSFIQDETLTERHFRLRTAVTSINCQFFKKKILTTLTTVNDMISDYFNIICTLYKILK